MVRLARTVRFSVNPFLDQDCVGSNAYTSKPSGQGLAVFLELTVEIIGPIDPDTGFIVNVVEIDQVTRQRVVPGIAAYIRSNYRQGRHIDHAGLVEMLGVVRDRLSDQFGKARVAEVVLKLNPYRKIMMETNQPGRLYFSEKFEFAAMHKLWNDRFSADRNFEIFGKCANPTGHGHNYVVEVTVTMEADGSGFDIGCFQQTVDSQLISLIDHRNLNVDIEAFGDTIPTIENLAAFAWGRLVGRFDPARLHSVTIWESDRTYCTYCGPADRSGQ